jgi:outer membrane lipoprotein SlyB
MVGGAATGAIVGGPVGAGVGAVVGAVAGAALEPPPEKVITYVQQQPVRNQSWSSSQLWSANRFPAKSC